MNLFGTKNPKTIKGEKFGYKTYILYLAPYTFNSFGVNVCSHATEVCANTCITHTGNGGMYNSVKESRRRKTDYFLSDRISFLNKLKKEIESFIKKSDKETIPVFRLNGTSDLRYEKFKVFDGKNIFELFPEVQFYDYTKNYLRFDDSLPSNYHLTFSRSEKNHDKAMELLSKGFNVAMVFNKVPKNYLGYEVIDGDESDLRFNDKKGVIVGLKYKKMTGKGADNSIAFNKGFGIKVES